MRAIIVDDEQPALDMLRLLLEEDGRVSVEGVHKKPREALEALAETRPDVAFLDVDMPQMNGMELARRLREESEQVEIIFVTAYSQYALDAFRHSALDYVLKPLTPEAIVEAVNRLYKRRPVGELQSEALPREAAPALPKVLPFGGLELMDTSGRTIRWRTLKTREMLAYFLVKEGQSVSKWDLLADLWPDLNEEQSRSHLHTTLYKLKKAVREAGGRDCIGYVSGQYRADFGSLDNPLRDFRELGRLRSALQDGAETAEACHRVIEAYNGELFGKLDYSWSYPYRKMCFEIFRSACLRLAGCCLGRHDPDGAADAVRRLLDQSEIDEDAHELMMHVHVERKDRVALRRQYELMCQILSSELGISPKPEVQLEYAAMMEKLGMEAT